METILVTGLILGLASNFHCLGMCGPIAMVLPLNRSNNWTILGGTLQYNLGRTLMYGLLGVLFGLLGVTIQVFGVLQWLSILAGIALVIFAWRKQLKVWFPHVSNPFGIQSGIQKLMGKSMKSKSRFRLFAFGAINGLLPCGMVYVALLNALLADSLVSSSLAMVAFGVGTLPVMIFIPFMSNKIGVETRKKLNRTIPYVLTVVGLMIALRGMNLGIPFVSPRISVPTATVVDEGQEQQVDNEIQAPVKMDCCHSGSDCE
ncbi:MAG: sulfite exporter TauE/SafE family protein [Flavobacteriales bacterium]|nr:sulfite exporter TauE/SafE family protein [Flavobacteriales bacterium]